MIARRLQVPRIIVALACAALIPALTVRGQVCDDFEDYSTNGFPGGGWNDVTTYGYASSGGPNPSVLVMGTTDAFGNPTRVVELLDYNHDSQGIYTDISVADHYVFSADVLVHQFSDPGQEVIDDWAMFVGVVDQGNLDFSILPQVGIYATATETQDFRLYVSNHGSTDTEDELLYDAVALDTWYTLVVDFDNTSGVIRSRIFDTETCDALVDATSTITNWSTRFMDDYNAFAAFDGELTVPPQNNLASVDNMVLGSGCNDCNENGVPDRCDIANGTSADCNTNGIPDGCDLAAGTSFDANTNGYPDECECIAPDTNCDNEVNSLDIGVVTYSGNWGQMPPACDRADVNGDGYVNVLDIGVIANSAVYQKPTGRPTPCVCITETPGAGTCPMP